MTAAPRAGADPGRAGGGGGGMSNEEWITIFQECLSAHIPQVMVVLPTTEVTETTNTTSERPSSPTSSSSTSSSSFSSELQQQLQQQHQHVLYKDESEIDVCRRLVEALKGNNNKNNDDDDDDDDDLITHAANTSYAYWYLATTTTTINSSNNTNNHNDNHNDDDTKDGRHHPYRPTPEQKVYAAMREARRHYVYMGRNFDKALKSLTESCQYRKTEKLDLLRTCFDPTHVYLDEDDEARARQMEGLIRSDMEKQYHILRGMDNKCQAVMIKYPRTISGTTEQSYLMAQIYMAERSTATTEFLSRGKYERSVAVYDYIGFDRAMSPPFAMQVVAATQMQRIYPERLQTLVMIEPPFWLKGVLGLLTPFLSESITQRIQLASGMAEREQVFTSTTLSVEPTHATALIRTDGQLSTPVSLDHFLVDLPFFYVYDMLPCTREVTVAELELDKLSHTMPETGPSLAEQASNLWGTWTSPFTAPPTTTTTTTGP